MKQKLHKRKDSQKGQTDRQTEVSEDNLENYLDKYEGKRPPRHQFYSQPKSNRGSIRNDVFRQFPLDSNRYQKPSRQSILRLPAMQSSRVSNQDLKLTDVPPRPTYKKESAGPSPDSYSPFLSSECNEGEINDYMVEPRMASPRLGDPRMGDQAAQSSAASRLEQRLMNLGQELN